MSIPCIYINLDHREDRRKQFEEQFESVCDTIALERFAAIKRDMGCLGCSLSHIECINTAKQKGLPYIVIMEDDFELLVSPTEFVASIQTILTKEWDVCVLSGYVQKLGDIHETHARVLDVQTTTAYIVRAHYYDTLLANFKEGAAQLAATGRHWHYAVDQFWKRLQGIDNWIIMHPLSGKQRISYSDLGRSVVNYDDIFLHSPCNRLLVRKSDTPS